MAKSKNTDSNQLDLIADLGFSSDEVTKILSEAKAKRDKETAKNDLLTNISNGIVFTQAKNSPLNTNGFWNDKPEIYSLHYVYTDKKGNKAVTAENKNKSFFMELARMSVGSELSNVINAVLNPAK